MSMDTIWLPDGTIDLDPTSPTGGVFAIQRSLD